MCFMLEKRTVHGEKAVHLGIATEAIDDNQVGPCLLEFSLQLAQWSPITTYLTKRVIGKATTGIDLEQHLRFELGSIKRAFASEDAQVCRAAFQEKRQPIIKGR